MLLKSILAASALPILSSAVTLQEAITSNSDLSSLGALLQTMSGTMSMLSSARNITLLAPSNSAISAFMNSTMGRAMAGNNNSVSALLSYHVLNGSYTSSQLRDGSQFVPTYLTNDEYTEVDGGQVVQIIKTGSTVSVVSGLMKNSTVTRADIPFDNGQIHIINSLLTIPTNISTALIEARLTSAWGAINATGAFEDLEDLRNVTIFAPNNEAFNNIGSIFANLSNDALATALGYHVVVGPRPLYSNSITGNTTVKALTGNDLSVRVNNGTVWVNGAKVVTPDFLIAGGVVHVIDQVLNNMNTTAMPTGTKGMPAFAGATSVSTTPFTSGVPTASQTMGGGASQATSTSSEAAGARITPIMMMANGAGALALAGAAALLI